MVSLTSARLPSSPQDFFIHCASLVTELEIEKQDYYGDFAFSSNDSWLRKFENEVSAHIGKDDAIFLPSGVMAQNIALKIAQENCAVMNNNKILCHYTSHLLNHEHNSYEFLLRMQAYITPLGPDLNRVDQRPLSWEDVKPYLDLPEAQRPHTLIVELPHRGTLSIFPFPLGSLLLVFLAPIHTPFIFVFVPLLFKILPALCLQRDSSMNNQVINFLESFRNIKFYLYPYFNFRNYFNSIFLLIIEVFFVLMGV